MRLYTQEEITLLKERYHSTGAAELARMMGRTTDAICQKAETMGLHKSTSYLKELYKKKVELMRSDNVNRKRKESLKKTYKAERRRILFGLPQKTKRKMVRMTRAKNGARTRMRKVGYVVTDDHNRIFYTPELTRHPKMEKNAEKNGIKIVPLREDEAANG